MSLSCRKAGKLIDQQVDGPLPEQSAKALSRHLESCDACRRDAEAMKATVSALKGIPETPLPDDFKERLVRRMKARRTTLRQRAQPAPILSGGRLGLLATAAILLVTMIGLQELLKHQSPPHEAPSPAMDEVALETSLKKVERREKGDRAPAKEAERLAMTQDRDGRSGRGAEEAQQRSAPATGAQTAYESDEEEPEGLDGVMARGVAQALAQVMPTHRFSVTDCRPVGPLVEADEEETCHALASARVIGESIQPFRPKVAVRFRLDLSVDLRGSLGTITVSEGAPLRLPRIISSWRIDTAPIPEGGLPATLRIEAIPK
jgi:hypothetical protein